MNIFLLLTETVLAFSPWIQ